MFGYVSIADLSDDVRANLHRIPPDIDLVVGIPRSGMIPAYMIGLYTNRVVVDVNGFLDNRTPGKGCTRAAGVNITEPQAAKHILLVDDSIASGQSLQNVLRTVSGSGFRGRITTCAVIAYPSKTCDVDLHFRTLPHPRIFEWNAFHHTHVEKSCFDL
ncbi:MAG: phosphoribosyltransferase, partial [Steroidobacteraceae bacterium]